MATQPTFLAQATAVTQQMIDERMFKLRSADDFTNNMLDVSVGDRIVLDSTEIHQYRWSGTAWFLRTIPIDKNAGQIEFKRVTKYESTELFSKSAFEFVLTSVLAGLLPVQKPPTRFTYKPSRKLAEYVPETPATEVKKFVSENVWKHLFSSDDLFFETQDSFVVYSRNDWGTEKRVFHKQPRVSYGAMLLVELSLSSSEQLSKKDVVLGTDEVPSNIDYFIGHYRVLGVDFKEETSGDPTATPADKGEEPTVFFVQKTVRNGDSFGRPYYASQVHSKVPFIVQNKSSGSVLGFFWTPEELQSSLLISEIAKGTAVISRIGPEGFIDVPL